LLADALSRHSGARAVREQARSYKESLAAWSREGAEKSRLSGGLFSRSMPARLLEVAGKQLILEVIAGNRVFFRGPGTEVDQLATV